MIIFSHRGIGFDKGENNLDGFKAAISGGFSVELDVQMTIDKKLVIVHDKKVKRTDGKEGIVSQLSFGEIGSVSLFEDLIQIYNPIIMKNTILAIHVKDENEGDILHRLSKEIKKNRLENRCIVFDLTIEGAKKIKLFNPNIRVALSVGEKRYTKTIHLWKDVKCLDVMDAIWLDEWDSGLYEKRRIMEIKEKEKPIYAVSPELHRIHNHPKSSSFSEIYKVWERLILWGVDGICTDHPIELKRFLKSMES